MALTMALCGVLAATSTNGEEASTVRWIEGCWRGPARDPHFQPRAFERIVFEQTGPDLQYRHVRLFRMGVEETTWIADDAVFTIRLSDRKRHVSGTVMSGTKMNLHWQEASDSMLVFGKGKSTWRFLRLSDSTLSVRDDRNMTWQFHRVACVDSLK